MDLPVEPSKEDCCNSGCNPCIFDVYEKQLQLFRKFKEKNEFSNHVINGISQLTYTKFCVESVMDLCDSHKVIRFNKCQMDNENTLKVWWNPGDHFLIKYCSGDGASCTRAYTPIKLKRHCSDKYDFSIIIKQYATGLVSNYLSNLKEGDETLWRGPYGAYIIAPNKYKRIIMVAQGTGIAPFMSVIDYVLENEDDMTNIMLFYCCFSEDVILFRNELYQYKLYWNFDYKIFLSFPKKSGKFMYQEPISDQKLSYEDFMPLKPFTITDQFLLCGSTSFMKGYEIFLQSEGVIAKNIVSF